MNIHKSIMMTATLVLFCLFGFAILSSRNFVNHSAQARGYVVRLNRDSDVYKPVVDFRTPDGTRIELQSNSGTSPPTYGVGEIVTVFYDPADPHSAVLDDWFSLWGGGAILGAMSLVFGFLTYVLYFRVSFKKSKRGKA
jgi:hypothetical protein